MKKNNNRHKKQTSNVYFINDIPNIYSIGGIIEDAVPYLGAASTALQLGQTLFGSQENTAAINQIKQNINDVQNASFSTGSSNDLLQDFNEQTLIGHISKSDLGKEGLFSNKLGRMAGRLNDQAAQANMAFYNNFNKAAQDLSQNQILSALSSGNIAAYGGDIHIKPENRGKFTALKDRTGKSATWFKEHGTPAQKKMATFALNAKKWKHNDGGTLSTHGLDLSNGVVQINNGNTHENNKYEGVQMGVDSQGIPNLVEQDEVIFNDYVFSNRIKVPDAVRSKYKLDGNKNMTFADAAKKAAKESEERPNDPISQRGLEDIMNKLQDEQEVVRNSKNHIKSNKFNNGGAIKFDKLINYPEGLSLMDYVEIPNSPKIPNISQRFDGLKSDIAHTRYNNRSLSDNSLTDDKDNFLRYIPALGNTLGAVATLFSKPDTSGARMIMNKANQAQDYARVNPTYLNDYLRYEPEDTDYLANRMAANAGAARANIMNLSGGNRANMMAGLLGANYASNTAIGDAYRQGILDDMQKRERYATFNRGTSQANQEAALKAAIANQQAKLDADKIGLSGYTTAASMIDAIDAQRAKTLSANLTNLFESLGQIGEEQYDKERLKWLERKGVLRSDYFDTGK